jgi:tyrosine-specific transport protein
MGCSREVGATLLVAGCSIGAGMLGVPVITGPTGFIPATVAFLLAWGFMLATGLLFVDLLLVSHVERGERVHLMSLAHAAYGGLGRWSVTILFGFLFYCVLVAYMLGGGSITKDFISRFGGTISEEFSIVLFTLLMGGVTLFGFGMVDRLNRALMVGLIFSYCLLLAIAFPLVEVEHLKRTSWSYMPACLPVMIIAFGYHNLVPTLVEYLDRKRNSIRRAILLGSCLPLLIYILWEIAILGAVHFTTTDEWKESVSSGDIVTRVLRGAGSSSALVSVAQWFGFFALATSFLPVTASFIDFYRAANKKLSQSRAFCLVLLPPLLFALFYPHFFLRALSAAGGYFAVLLFGLLPALLGLRWATKQKPLRRKIYLFSIILFAVAVFGIEFSNSFFWG